jgi:hypothetical protein
VSLIGMIAFHRLLPEISLASGGLSDDDAPRDGVGEGQIYHNFVGMRAMVMAQVKLSCLRRPGPHRRWKCEAT